MKKTMAILLASIMFFSLAACGSTDKNSNNSHEKESSETADKSESAANDTSSVIEKSTTTAGKTIVVYFSGSGNTKRVAEFVADETGAELFELIPSEPYTDKDLNWRNSGSRVNKEHNNPDLQDIALTTIQILDWESYDTVFVGYPIWWHEAAWPINNFVKGNDFTGKQVIPFCTSTSSGFGESGGKLAKMAGTGTWLDGMRFPENGAESDIRRWVQSLNLETGVSAPAPQNENGKNDDSVETVSSTSYDTNTKISEVQNDPVFGNYGRLIFPVDSGYMSGSTLGDLRLTWYNNIDPDKTVEICNYLKTLVESGETVFYDIYSDAEKAADPAKEDTGLFVFKGDPGARVAIVNAGGGFAYVGAMHDSFPHALELSRMGYNAFALIYRPGAQTACEDLARTIAFIHDHEDELQVDTRDYSLWGGSAGGRMAAWLGSYGTKIFGEKEYPRPAAVIVNYTGLSEVTGTEPPTYSAVGTNDGIASYRTMERRINAIKSNGTNAEIEIFNGLSHGFGIGNGTVAEGWLARAAAFWERNME